jgi:hypothetical protein
MAGTVPAGAAARIGGGRSSVRGAAAGARRVVLARARTYVIAVAHSAVRAAGPRPRTHRGGGHARPIARACARGIGAGGRHQPSTLPNAANDLLSSAGKLALAASPIGHSDLLAAFGNVRVDDVTNKSPRARSARCSDSRRAANACNGSAQRCDSLRRTAEKPHEPSDPVPSVVFLATLEVACHAGGRGFESRRSRFDSPLQTQGPRVCRARGARLARAPQVP